MLCLKHCVLKIQAKLHCILQKQYSLFVCQATCPEIQEPALNLFTTSVFASSASCLYPIAQQGLLLAHEFFHQQAKDIAPKGTASFQVLFFLSTWEGFRVTLFVLWFSGRISSAGLTAGGDNLKGIS